MDISNDVQGKLCDIIGGLQMKRSKEKPIIFLGSCRHYEHVDFEA
jgi:hypothetical protein